MSRCLRDQTLLLLYEGEGTSAHRIHLETCAACAARHQRLVRDLEVIGQVLQQAPALRQAQDRPSQVIPYRPHFLRLRWMPMAAALAVALVLVWGGLWVRGPSPPVSLAPAHNEAALFFLGEVSTILFSTVDARAAMIPAPVSDFAYWQAALEGEWPCEGQDSFFSPGCNDHSFSLLFEG